MTFDRERPYLGENRLQAWPEAAVASGVELPDHLEARRQRWRALAGVSSGDDSGDGVEGRADPSLEREEGPRP